MLDLPKTCVDGLQRDAGHHLVTPADFRREAEGTERIASQARRLWFGEKLHAPQNSLHEPLFPNRIEPQPAT